MTQFLSYIQAAVAAHGHDDSGATMVEYGLMILFVALACFAAVQAFGGSVSNLFGPATTALAGV